ncbi:hypothetical protein GPECTOR_4g704 [Gonium pectorale]|uniref:Uncharacterized protein n=1 Tax=Gonium pectorale TaxID=33097 RepID=A0A150GY83_GONPE|nr:hypothetical protein GPECTOR_4g704 [Gonium pectorale]|eukprot:KXZ54638.1 hypothetical protein GPECTOR_4g704 [Gonium pectorale]
MLRAVRSWVSGLVESSARKPGKRPASELNDHDAPQPLPFADLSHNGAAATPTAAPRTSALDNWEHRSSKRLAADPAGPHTGPWWMKQRSSSATRSAGAPVPLPLPPATEARRPAGLPSSSRLGSASGLAHRAALPGTGHGASTGGAEPSVSSSGATGNGVSGNGLEDTARAQWQRAVRVSVGTIRPAQAPKALPPVARRPLKRWYEGGEDDEEGGEDDFVGAGPRAAPQAR